MLAPAIRLLVVEDDSVFRRYILAALAKADRTGTRPTQAVTVGTLRDALAALPDRPDCVLLDLGLPDSRGLDTLQAVLRAAPEMPVVVLTGTEEEELADQALRAGAQDFLDKAHLKPDSLGRALRHALDRAAWAAQINAKNRELEERNRDLDDFAHAVSHDLKAPLRAIFHLAEEAQEQVAQGDTAAAGSTLAAIDPRIRRLSGMIDGLLRFTTAGRRHDMAPVDLSDVVREVLDSLAPPPGFQVTVAHDLPVVLGTRVAWAQVMQNLIDNAIKHHPGPGGNIRIGWRDAAEHYEILVCDDGAGIPLEQREHVFQLFHTLGSGGSTGIGLALVRKVVQQAGGNVVAEGNGEQGTCFRITWPKAGPRAVQRVAPAALS
jgi:signal transduction histidine kinase